MADIESLFFRQEYIGNNNFIQIDEECPIKESTYVIISNATDTQQQKLIYLSNQVENSNDVETLLNHLNWRMFIYSCEQQSCCNSTYSSYQLQHPNCSNTTCCFSDSIDNLFSFSARCGNTSCTEAINSYVSQVWFLFLILGFVCLLGNVVVMCDKAISLCKAQNRGKETQIYYMLVFNLALSDLLMGVYLTVIAFEIKHKAAIGVFFSEPTLCNVLAVVNNISSQVSLTIIFIISYYRFVGVIYPYKKQHFKFAVTAIISTWTIWLVVAALPMFSFEPFKSSFAYGLVKNRQLDKNSVIDFSNLKSVLQTKILPNFSNVTEVTSIIHAVVEFPRSSVMQKLSIALGWINSNNDNWELVGYYDRLYVCSILYLVENKSFRHYSLYILILLFYNLVFSIATLIFYLAVTFKIYENHCLCYADCKKCRICFSFNNLLHNTNAGPANTMRSVENRKIFKRISIIMITDVMCWIPLCITSLIIWKFADVTAIDWEEHVVTAIPFQTALSVVVPLNSIVNPYIYSYKLWIQLFKKLKEFFSIFYR